MMRTSLWKKSSSIASTVILASFLLISTGPYEEHHYLHFAAEGVVGEECVEYEEEEEDEENTITINCNTSFLDVVQTISDPDILENTGAAGEYILNATLEVADGVTFEMTSSNGGSSDGGDGLQYLKLAGENGIIVYGKILIDGVKITSWDIADEDVILQDRNGTISRGFVQFAASEGAQILNSEFGYLGYAEPGRRGFDLFGEGPSHDMKIRGSKFHNMWFAFYSNSAYNITVDGNEYYNNIKYALDPHTTTHDMNITKNLVHNNPAGIICSDRCYNILIEGNMVQNNSQYGIHFSRNMTDSIARNNQVTNSTSGIVISESPNNQIYNNTIEGTTLQGILLFNPSEPDDGLTVNNLVYNNTISNSLAGINATRSYDNILENNRFSDIESNEYRLAGNASIIIRGQEFENATISEIGSAPMNLVEIVDSGIIEVRGVDADEEQEEADLYNTNLEPYNRTLSEDESITVNSS
jgi:poly(beta-D-mannuronate) C5 epimerase